MALMVESYLNWDGKKKYERPIKEFPGLTAFLCCPPGGTSVEAEVEESASQEQGNGSSNGHGDRLAQSCAGSD